MTQWFLTRDGETIAQYSTEEFKAAVAKGRIRRTDYIRRSDSSTFVSAGEFLPSTYQPKSGAAGYFAGLFATAAVAGVVIYAGVVPAIRTISELGLTQLQQPAQPTSDQQHDAIRQALLSEADGFFQLLAQKDAHAFEELVAHVAAEAGADADMISVARQYLMKSIIEPRSRYLSDDDKVASMTLTRDMSAHLAGSNPQMCIAVALGRPAGDIRSFLTPDLSAREQALMLKMLDTTEREIELLPAASLQELNKKVAVKLYEAHADQIALLDLGNVPTGQEAAACQMFVAYLDGVLALPREESVALIRAMMSDPSLLSAEAPAEPAATTAQPAGQEANAAAPAPTEEGPPVPVTIPDPPAAADAAPADAGSGAGTTDETPFPEGLGSPQQ